MTLEENKDIVRRFTEDFLNRGDLTVADELLAPDCIGHYSGASFGTGPEAYKRQLMMFKSAFPDVEWPIEDIIAEGDRVRIRAPGRGTHRGEFMGIAPTGKQVQFGGIGIFRIINGKITEHWYVPDRLGLLQQLGATISPS